MKNPEWYVESKRKEILIRALRLAYRSTIDEQFKKELDEWLTELGKSER